MRTARDKSPLHLLLIYLGIAIGLVAHAGVAEDKIGPVEQWITVTSLVENPETIADWQPVLRDQLAQLPEGAVLYFPRGEYTFGSVLELHQGVTILFDGAAKLKANGSLFSILSGSSFRFEGIGGKPRLEAKGAEAEVFYLLDGDRSIAPDLTLKSLHLVGFRGVNGVSGGRWQADGASLGDVLVEDCHFEADDMHFGINQGTLESLRIDNSLFTGMARLGIFVPSPIHNGVTIRGNRLIDVGIAAIRIGGGAANMIDDGAVEYVSSVIVHENHVLGGGQRAPERTSYIFGILVYGNNVSIQGNIVRDFNRGEPVPGERVGHHFKLDNGTWHRGPWVARDGNPRVRLAGAAIYAKARYGVISNNVCTNSGWRSVIEVKTGGREPYFLVANNIVDGRSLSIEDSFGFEPNVARSLWVNNVVSDMPNMAFKVSNRMEAAYIGNAIYDSKIGFSISDTVGANPELILNNYFVNVEYPVVGLSEQRMTAQVAMPPSVTVESVRALPKATDKNRGQIAFVKGAEGDRMYVAARIGEDVQWLPLGAGEGEAIAGVGVSQWKRVGENLALNPLQDRDGPTPAEEEVWKRSTSYNTLPFGWSLSLSNREIRIADLFRYRENVQSPSGSRVLEFGGGPGTPESNWIMQQQLPLKPGHHYLAEAVVRRSDNQMTLTLIVDNGKAQESIPAEKTGEWETLQLVFTVPESDAAPYSRLRIHSSKTGDGSVGQIDSVTITEVERK